MCSGFEEATWGVGPFRFEGRAILAPMAGVTDLGMRKIARRYGAAFTVSEMVYAEDRGRGAAETRLRASGQGLDLHVVQIAGCQAEDIRRAAQIAEDSGAAMIDINMGCPSKRVTGGLAGSALMRDLDHATSLIKAAVAATGLPVSVKMRLGWDDASLNAPELARRAEAEGVVMVTVHGRTRQQFFQGRASWNAIRTVKDAVSIPVVANGDCESPGDAAAMLKASGADAVMIGRAAVGQPWLVGQVAQALATGAARAVPDTEKREAMLDHYESLLASMGVEQGKRHARKHLAAYAKHVVPQRTDLARQLVTCENPATVRVLIQGLFDADQRSIAA